MAHLPSHGTDPDLAALSQRGSAPAAAEDSDAQEHIDLSLASRDRLRRESIPESFTSEQTTGTSLYADAESAASAGGSQTTIQRSETDHSWTDAHETLSRAGDSGSDLAHQGIAPAESAMTLNTIPAASPLSDVTPTGTLRGPPANLDATPRARQSNFSSLVPPMAPTVSLGSSKDASINDLSEKPSMLASKEGGTPSGNSTPDSQAINFENPELAHLTDEQRRIVAEQVCVLAVELRGAREVRELM